VSVFVNKIKSKKKKLWAWESGYERL
jgi:hypothetical protein